MKLSLFLLLFLNNLIALEVFTKDKIIEFMTKENPYIYTATGQEHIYKQKEKYMLGNFDTKLSVKYDKKEYPVSKGDYVGVSVAKPIENGMEFNLGYRMAKGTQEYNNIKTSDQGEAQLGIKIPFFSVVNDISKRKLDLHNAALETTKSRFKSKDNLRLLYFEITSIYNKLLYHHTALQLEQALQERALKRKKIITKKVSIGELADIALIEVDQQVINRNQRLISASNSYENTLETFLKYLNLEKKSFKHTYTLPMMPEIITNKLVVYSLENILNDRADLKVYNYQIKQINLQNKQTNLLQYPKFNIGLYGVHDFKYDNGFKISLDMDFPIERRKYEAKSLENRLSIKNIQMNKEKKILNIQAKINNINNSMYTIAKNIQSSQKEVQLVEKLEEVENKKYKLGVSNLFMVNQREIYTLQIKMKLLKYQLDYINLEQELEREMGVSFKI